jgi:F-type H+-transporting ATPase subunit a
MVFLAEGTPVGHVLTPICGDGAVNLVILKFYYCAISLDTLVSSGLAIAVTLVLAFLIASRLNPRVPGKLQMVLEFLLDYVAGMVRETVAEDAPRWIVPLAATIGFYILVANWLDFLPLPREQIGLQPANSILNQTLAMALTVVVIVQFYSIRVLGLGGYLRRFTKPFDLPVPVRIAFLPLNLIEELVKPVTLSLRLYGNIFAGVLMIYLITLLPFWLSWFPASVWKAFDVFFVGTLQAFIFMLLTIIYFQQAREGLDEEEHGGHNAPAPASRAETGLSPGQPI